MKSILTSALLSLLAFAGSAQGATFTRFSPATGVLVGDESSYVTTPAVSADITGLWSGTCDATTFLRGDGSCQPEPNVGTVTSVGLTMPTGFSVANSPITISGTLDVTTLLDGLIVGTGSGFAEATSADVIELWTGTCDAINFLGGDGTCKTAVTSVGLTVPSGFTVTGSPVTTSGNLGIETTLSGVIAGTGSGFTQATSADVIDLWSGTCTAATEYLAADGTCQSITFANPTASVGLTAVNGVATTYMRSDAAPALSQAITPTWTNVHIFSGNNALDAVSIIGTSPALFLSDTDATVDNRNWRIQGSSDRLQVFTVNDARNAGNEIMNIDRTGITVDSVAFPTNTANSFLIGSPPANQISGFSPTLQVAGSSRGAVISNTSVGNSTLGVWNLATSGNNELVGFFTETSPTGRGSINYNRGSNVIAYNTTSDRRLKKNILDAEPSGDKIDAMRVREYDWKNSDAHTAYGFVAQELYEVAPIAVTPGDSGEEIEQVWAVDPAKLVPMLVKEIQDLRKRVSDLETAN